MGPLNESFDRPSPADLAGGFDLLAEAAAAGDGPYSGIVTLSENEPLEIQLPSLPDPQALAGLQFMLRRSGADNLLKVSYKFDDAGRPCLRLDPGDAIGFSALADPRGRRILLRVESKLPNVALLELCTLAERLPSWHPGEVSIDLAPAPELGVWIIQAFAQVLRHLVEAGGLKPSHELATGHLRNRLRGRLLIPQYVHALAAGHPNVIPCEYPSLDLNNGPNQILRWALHLAIVAAAELPTLRSTLRVLHALVPRFHRIELRPPRPRVLLASATLPPSMRSSYARPLQLARMLIDSIHFDPSVGDQPAPTVAISMEKVFEKAFANMVEQEADSATLQDRWTVDFSSDPRSGDSAQAKTTAKSTFKPDIWIPSSSDRPSIVIDTKWKVTTKQTDDADIVVTGGTRLRSSDLFQITTYALQLLAVRNERACIAVLVYPGSADTESLVHTVIAGGLTIEIRLEFWNVTTQPGRSFGRLWERLGRRVA